MQALILRASSNTTLALKVLELQKLLAPANGNSTGFICSKIGGIQALSLSAVIAQPIRTDLLAGLSGQYMDLSQLTGAQQFNKVVSELANSCDGEKQDYGRLGFLVRLLDYSLKSQ